MLSQSLTTAASRPASVSAASSTRLPSAAFSFTFPESPARSAAAAAKPPLPASCASRSRRLTRVPIRRDSKTATRIKPPGDIIKLEDRLYYVLQPPLETLLQSDALHFPFEPFPYQYQGVAFLYPRYSAILADEMGLGKTMQAITAVRMLLRSGELRQRAADLPQAAGHQLAARVQPVGAGNSADDHRRRPGQTALAMDRRRTPRSRSPTTSC